MQDHAPSHLSDADTALVESRLAHPPETRLRWQNSNLALGIERLSLSF